MVKVADFVKYNMMVACMQMVLNLWYVKPLEILKTPGAGFRKKGNNYVFSAK